ncbi:elongation factor G [Necator americanus]|uniref:Elongation factor G n=1 Tax=Necator americanus TaxID=51031 RepID=W2T3S4_NECAM|nr:elongation factor G [Necator americanus]ETN75627.1 elongation factor G [Necator americanus]
MQYLVGNSGNHPFGISIQECSPTGVTVLLVVKFMRTEGRKFAICRVFSGKIAAGDKLYLLGRKGLKEGTEIPKIIVESVWALRGRDLLPLKSATAGVICAIEAQGLVQNATLCSEQFSEGLDVGIKRGEPLVRVSVNTANLDDMDKLKEDLKVLAVLDSSLRIETIGCLRATSTFISRIMVVQEEQSGDHRNHRKRSESRCRPFDQAIISGFELFVTAGPLCHEVMRGVAVIVEEWKVNEDDAAVAGQLMTAMRATCKAGAEKLALRLVAAMYKCTVTTASQALGKVHAVLAQRKSKVLNEDINEATGLFEVTALMPVVESFSFCDHLRKNTSGMASAQLEFSHWQLIDEDPYWQPSTLEEMEEFGVKGDSPNHARGYMDAVRRRKGLSTDDVIVVSAEKQRNLKKNK